MTPGIGKALAKKIFEKVMIKAANETDPSKNTDQLIKDGKANYHSFLRSANDYSAAHRDDKDLMKDVVQMGQEKFPSEQRTQYSDTYANSLSAGKFFLPTDRYNYGLEADSAATSARFANNPKEEIKQHFNALMLISTFAIGVPFLLGLAALSRLKFLKNIFFSGLKILDNTFRKLEEKGIERKYSKELFKAYKNGDKEKASELENKCLEKAGISIEDKNAAPEADKDVKEVAKKEIKLEELKDKNNIKLTEKIEEKIEEKTIVEDKEIVK